MFERDHFAAIDVSHGPMGDDGCYVHFEVEASEQTIYVRVTCD
jgi:hypothetical protein